jgi:hypothetical protein
MVQYSRQIAIVENVLCAAKLLQEAVQRQKLGRSWPRTIHLDMLVTRPTANGSMEEREKLPRNH